MKTIEEIKECLEYLREEIVAERISYGEIAELQSLADHIDPGDVLLLEWAGVPEFPEEVDMRNVGNIMKCERIDIEKFKPVPGINKRYDFETRSGVDELIQINILTELTSERLLVVLKRLCRLVSGKKGLDGHDDKIDGYDDTSAGCKKTSCSWGLCSDSFGMWPYPQDHQFPYDFLNDGRISPLDYQGYCPMQDKRTPGEGCFYSCRFFQKNLSTPTRDEYLKMIDEKIAEIERKIEESK